MNHRCTGWLYRSLTTTSLLVAAISAGACSFQDTGIGFQEDPPDAKVDAATPDAATPDAASPDAAQTAADAAPIDAQTSPSDAQKPPVITLFATNLVTANLGGRSGADLLCATTQSSLSLACPTAVHAFLTVGTSDQLVDMATNFTVPLDEPIASISNVTIATNWSALFMSALSSSLGDAAVLPSTHHWWSGSDTSGASDPGAANQCTAWSVNSHDARANVGAANTTDSTWLDSSQQACNATRAVLCLCY